MLAFVVCMNLRISAAQDAATERPSNTIASTSGQDSSGTQNSSKNKKASRNGSFVFAPLPISSPAIGSGIVPVVGYIFSPNPKDSVSPASVIGAAGVATDNGTRALFIGGDFYFKQDTYEIKSAFGKGNLNYDIYRESDAGFKLPLKQKGQVFFASVSRRVGWQFFVGLRGLAGNSLLTVRQNDNTTVPIPADVGLTTALSSVGL